MFSSRSQPNVDKTALVSDAPVVNAVVVEKSSAENADANPNEQRAQENRGGCKRGKCCAGMALIGVPLFILLSPIIIPTLLIRRALYGPMKCGGKCNRDKNCTADDTEEKDANKNGADEDNAPKADRT